MSENKNIERLFQEKFKDFEAIPHEHVWENIEAGLDKKEKRRIIPFWWRLSGVAAALLIGFLITNALFFSNPIVKNNNVVNKENKIPTKIQPDGKSNENTIEQNSVIVKEKEAIVASDSKKSVQEKLQKTFLKSVVTNSKNNNGIASSDEINKIKKTTTRINQKKSGNNANLNQAVIIENKDAVATNLKKKGSGISKNNSVTSSNLEKKQHVVNTINQVASTDLKKEKTTVENKSVINNTNQKAIANKKNPTSKDITNTKSTFENKSSESINPNKSIVAENTTKEIKNIDTTKIAVVTNALEELLKEKEVKKKAEPKLNRWQVATTVAPIYFSSTSGNGSPLDSRFESNDKEFKPSYSYGLGVNYSLNKKWSVRTGVNALALEYKTNNVVFFQTANARQIEHVKSNLQGSMIEIDNKENNGIPELSLNSEIIEKFNGSINQKIGYIEVPVEVSYKLMDKKFGIDVITGFSSLFLNENSVSLLSSGESISIGRANNLNDFHFSGNLGFGFRYRFWKAFNANVNPMFKYQMNTFNSNAGNFKPYAFGLYSGVSYTF